MKKSAIGTANTFGVTLGDTNGRVTLSMGSTVTRSLSEGRYLYDVNVSSGSTFFKIIEVMCLSEQVFQLRGEEWLNQVQEMV